MLDFLVEEEEKEEEEKKRVCFDYYDIFEYRKMIEII